MQSGAAYFCAMQKTSFIQMISELHKTFSLDNGGVSYALSFSIYQMTVNMWTFFIKVLLEAGDERTKLN